MAPKLMPKSIKNSIKKIIDFRMFFSSKREPKWSPRGAQMETKMIEFRRHFATPSQEPSKGGFGEGSGWIWAGFLEGFGRILHDFWRILNEISEGVRLNFRRRVWGRSWMDLGRILGGF